MNWKKKYANDSVVLVDINYVEKIIFEYNKSLKKAASW